MFNDMAGERVVLTLRRGKGREVTVPTENERRRIAECLHHQQSPFVGDVLGWRVVYFPRSAVRWASQQVDPFTGARGEVERRESEINAYCVIGHDQDWQVACVWDRSDAEPSWRHERGKLSPVVPEVTLF